MIKAEIIADSKNEWGDRITSFVLTFPRMILAEFNTHRAISKNSASSRAIPFERMLKMVKENPFVPIRWMKDHKGMQGSEYLNSGEKYKGRVMDGEIFLRDVNNTPEELWFEARDKAILSAKALSSIDVTKQFCNRLIEPYMWHTVICTGTEWENFFALRAHPAAEIHMQALAEKMLDVYNASTPKQLKYGEWHIPFGDNIDKEQLMRVATKEWTGDENHLTIPPSDVINKIKLKIASARCARVSYLNFEGKDDYEADIKLHDSLVTAGHMSPFEHCAKAMPQYMEAAGEGWSGNFKGFWQYRKTLIGENKTDSRVIKK